MRFLKLMVIVLGFVGLGDPTFAAPQVYDVDRGKSRIEFIYSLDGKKIVGSLPLDAANVTLDFDNLANSRITVVLGMAKIRAGSLIATEAIRSQNVLSTKAYPQARFISRLVRRTNVGAAMEGDLTLRGITRAVKMRVRIFGNGEDDNARLSLLVEGELSRAEFGAKGYPQMVDDKIELRIRVELARE